MIKVLKALGYFDYECSTVFKKIGTYTTFLKDAFDTLMVLFLDLQQK